MFPAKKAYYFGRLIPFRSGDKLRDEGWTLADESVGRDASGIFMR